jgi:hypothetical protein
LKKNARSIKGLADKSCLVFEQLFTFQIFCLPSRSHNKKPVLVFDFISLSYRLLNDPAEKLCGGRHNRYIEEFEQFLKKANESADLVFFADGSVMPEKYANWIERQNGRSKISLEIIEETEDRLPLETIIRNNENLPNATYLLRMMETLARKYGKVFYSFDKECDTELVHYACKNPSVLAILGNDSDFLIFPGEWRYFSLKDLDLSTLKTIEFDKQALRTYLKLDDEQLKILSTLAGNDIMKYDYVKTFHAKNCTHDAKKKFPRIAECIRKFKLKDDDSPISDICLLIYGDKIQDEMKKKMIRDSLKQYDVVSLSNCKTNFLLNLNLIELRRRI